MDRRTKKQTASIIISCIILILIFNWEDIKLINNAWGIGARNKNKKAQVYLDEYRNEYIKKTKSSK